MATQVLISGGSGLLGKAITNLLTIKGYEVAILSRKRGIEGIKSFYWDYEKSIIDKDAIEFADVIIHLAGENIAGKRWTKKQKQIIIDSRVQTSELLFSAIKEAKSKPRTIISASAIGYYGTKTTQHIYTEDDEAGSDFLADCVVQWEKSVDQFQELGIQVFKFRIGVVLSNQGGALQKMLKPIRAGFGAVLGSGKQYIPWIEISDLARIFLFAIEKKLTNSVYNAVAPDFITNRDFTKILANKLSRHLFLPNIPVFILKLFMGEMSSILLYGSRVSAKSITSEGFDFLYQKLDDIPISGK